MQSGQKASAKDAFLKRKIDGLIAQKLREAKTLQTCHVCHIIMSLSRFFVISITF